MGLKNIVSDVQKTADAIYSILGIDVTVVDENLIRIAGTGFYKTSIGEQVIGSSIFDKVMKKKEDYYISDPKFDEICKCCISLDTCKEMAELCCPILLDSKVVGVIGLIAFDQSQKERLEENHNSLLDFIRIMSDLLASKLGQSYKSEKLEKILSNVTHLDIEILLKDIIGDSNLMKSLKDRALKVAKSDSTVLISGESGTGKELFARAIHFESDRKNKPFIAINCAAIPDDLIESELFGYEEGGFTGAKKGGKSGKFELADTGTIFLDEIGEMKFHLQAKLLRVLQEGIIDRVGGIKPKKIDVRVIAATNKNLHSRVESGQFREDLFYRLNVIPIEIPPLRYRENDILLIADKIIEKTNIRLGKNVDGISDKVKEIFLSSKWKGNVRELENIIEYSINMSLNNTINIADLPNSFLEKGQGEILRNMEKNEDCKPKEAALAKKYMPKESRSIRRLEDLEKEEIQNALEKYGAKKEGIDMIVASLGISRATLYRKFKKYNML